MTNLIIIAIMGTVILTASTLAFGATLSTPLEFNLIGASDNTPVAAARANVTAIDFIQEVGSDGVIQTNGTIFSVGNEDPVSAHIFEICLTLEGPIGIFIPAAGQSPACITTQSIPANAIYTGNTLYMPSNMNITSLENISLSIEETT